MSELFIKSDTNFNSHTDISYDTIKEMKEYYDSIGCVLSTYQYGGIMSSRCGLYIVSKDNLNKVIGTKLLWMS